MLGESVQTEHTVGVSLANIWRCELNCVLLHRPIAFRSDQYSALRCTQQVGSLHLLHSAEGRARSSFQPQQAPLARCSGAGMVMALKMLRDGLPCSPRAQVASVCV